MAYEIKMLDLIDIELEASFLVLGRGMGTTARVKTWGYLIMGPGTDPIIVDTGASHPEIMERLGMKGIVTKEMTIRRQLARFGVKINDVRWILHTHHHIDHAGQDAQF
ncbi:MAG: MBL fold metallo-hydrolase, partial [Thermoleophilia bacterium]|nr:MBL fold metallo-hydrolase [Thermoleophilia bacterium]